MAAAPTIDPQVLPSSVSRRDIALAAAAVGLDTLLFTSIMENAENRGWSAFDPSAGVVALLGLAAFPALALRRRAPVAVSLGLSAYAAALTLTIGSRPLASLLVALYTAAALRPVRRSGWCLVATLGAHSMTVAYETSAATSNWLTIAGVAIVFTLFDLAAWFLGRWAAATSRHARQLIETREAMAEEAVSAERLRIARELHDIVAHAVTVMVLQVAGARRQLTRDPALAEAALQSVEAVGKQAMAELRRLLEVLRTVSAADDDLDAEATASLANLEVLVKQAETAGVTVKLSARGVADRLDPSVELTAYRIVQEALTNVTRHAGPGAHAEVILSRRDGSIAIDVENDQAGTVPAVTSQLTSGYGLVGLRERVKLMGGEISTGARDEGGYRVHATLPAVRS
jgi:signal transduction histidine kinase